MVVVGPKGSGRLRADDRAREGDARSYSRARARRKRRDARERYGLGRAGNVAETRPARRQPRETCSTGTATHGRDWRDERGGVPRTSGLWHQKPGWDRGTPAARCSTASRKGERMPRRCARRRWKQRRDRVRGRLPGLHVPVWDPEGAMSDVAHAWVARPRTQGLRGRRRRPRRAARNRAEGRRLHGRRDTGRDPRARRASRRVWLTISSCVAVSSASAAFREGVTARRRGRDPLLLASSASTGPGRATS